MKVCIPFKPGASGGPSTFYRKFSAGLEARGHQTTPTPAADCDVMMSVIYSSPRPLMMAKRFRLPIVQRLDGVYAPDMFRDWRRRNFPMWINYRFFTTWILFQSEFSRQSCLKHLGRARVPSSMVYNGVDLQKFSPHPAIHENKGIALTLLSTFLRDGEIRPVVEAFEELYEAGKLQKLIVVGKFAPNLAHLPKENHHPGIEWRGQVPHHLLPELYREAGLLISSKLRAPCPNIVLEAMASGLPVACYESGAHSELVEESAGICVPLEEVSGPDPYLDPHPLAEAAATILQDYPRFAQGARQTAEKRFSLDSMIDHYLETFNQAIDHHQRKR